MMHDIPLILFAKAPVEGEVKTRLMPQLTRQQATRVAEVLLEETIKLARDAWQGKVVLAVWPSVNHPFILQMCEKYKIDYMQQTKGDLGEKMYHAMQAQSYPCAIMGCDVPHCEPMILKRAYQELQNANNVIGLTVDGGYYFLALQNACSALFQSIEWGGDDVSRATLAIAEQNKIVFERLKMLNDIDEYADLVSAARQLPTLAQLLN